MQVSKMQAFGWITCRMVLKRRQKRTSWPGLRGLIDMSSNEESIIFLLKDLATRFLYFTRLQALSTPSLS